MRIGVDARELQGRPTGTGRYLRNLLKAWPAGDTVFLYFNGGVPDGLATPPGMTVRPAGSGGSGLVWSERHLPPIAGADSLDVFFAPSYFCPLRLGLPRVTTVHDMSFFSLPEDFPLVESARRRWLVRWSLRASARVIAVSEFTAREIASYFPGVRDRVVTIHEAADADIPPAPTRAEARRHLALSGPMLLSVGSILNRRRLPALLSAVHALVRRHSSLILDVVGDNRTSPPLDLRALVHRLGLDPHVRLSGFVSDEELALRYAAADACVYLSEYEGFGLPVLEAMARGIPVLTSRRPATGELFAEAAVLAEPDDPADITRGLDRLLDAPDGFVERGRRCAAGFSWTAAAARTRAVLAEAAGA